jgi:RecB family exonuclease
MKAWKNSSASQVKAWLRCPSRWHWNKIMGLETPTSKAMELGTAKHAELEEYAKTGDPSGLSSITRPIVETGFMPELPIPEEQIERRLDLETPFVPIVGYIDLEDENSRTVTDHKTTSAWKYTKEPAELGSDPQAIIYLKDALDRWGGDAPIRFRHIYYMTRGTPGVRQTFVDLEPEKIEKKYRQILEVIGEMHADSTKAPEEVAVNESACGDYGGCPFKTNCQGCGKIGAFAGMFDSKPKTETENKNEEKTTMSSYAEMLAARKAGTSVPKTITHAPEPEEAQPEIVAAAVNPPDGTPMDEIPAPEPDTEGLGDPFADNVDAPTPPNEDTAPAPGGKSKDRGALKHNDELVSTMSKADLSSAWHQLASNNAGELEWDGESKATRKTIQTDVITMLDGGIEDPQPVEEPTTQAEPVDAVPERDYADEVIETTQYEVDDNIAAAYDAGMMDAGAKASETVTSTAGPDVELVYEESEALELQITQLETDLKDALEKLDGMNGQSGPCLYIGCHPHGQAVIYADEIIEPLQARVAEGASVPHYNMIEYGEGPKRVASFLRAHLMNGHLALPKVLVVDRRNPCADAVIDVLVPMYRKVGGLIVERMG